MKYYYTYTILFDDGYYYHGKRTSKVPPENDVRYNGSPRKNKNKWTETKFIKIIEGIYKSPEELILAEYNLIGDKYKTDDLCLNAHNGMKFHNVNGTPHTEKSKERISNAHKGKERSQQHKENISKARKKYYEENYDKNPMFDDKSRKKWEEVIQSEEYKMKQLQSSHRRKEIYIDGILYLSMNDAAKRTGIPYHYIETRSKKTNSISSEDYFKWLQTKNSTKGIEVEIDGVKYSSIGKAHFMTKIPISYIKMCIEKNQKISFSGYISHKQKPKCEVKTKKK